MRFRVTREDSEPKQYAAKITSKISGAVVFLIDTPARPLAKGFYKGSQKPVFFYNYRDTARRAAHVAEWLKNVDASATAQQARRAAKKAFRHTLKIGDILNTSWGYEQTNVEFFQVIALVGDTMVEVMEVSQRSERTNSDSGKCFPIVGAFVGKVRRHRVLPGNALDIHHADFGRAYPYDGGPCHWSDGH